MKGQVKSKKEIIKQQRRAMPLVLELGELSNLVGGGGERAREGKKKRGSGPGGSEKRAGRTDSALY